MRTFLLVWNPNRWEWRALSAGAASATPDTPFPDVWGTGTRYNVPAGSDFFMLRLGVPPRGIIGYGKIVSAPVEMPHFDPAKVGETYPQAGIEFHRLLDPYRSPILEVNRLLQRQELAEYNWAPQSSGVELPEPQASVVRQMWADHLKAVDEAEAVYPRFDVGTEYRRRDIQDQYGGQERGGISTPRSVRAVFLFTGDSGSEFGYRDGYQSDGTFWYTGEGQVGDMEMNKGNLAIRDHVRNQERLYLFQVVRKGWCRFMGEAAYLSHHETMTHDRIGQQRKAFVFELEILGTGTSVTGGMTPTEPIEVERELAKKSQAELRRIALERSFGSADPKERKVLVRIRSQAVKLYVLARANGVCEACGQPAPFTTVKGNPYLEPHHLTRLADDGPDHPDWVAAICPNCHRRVHYGVDGAEYNATIRKQIARTNYAEAPE